MSRAFAIKARNSALVMHSSDDYADPPQDGIWGRVEFPVLRGEIPKLSRGVDELMKLDEEAKRLAVFWTRFKNAVDWHLSQLQKGWGRVDLRKRGAGVWSAEACMAPSEYAFFDNVNW
jgi:hypothetical protein